MAVRYLIYYIDYFFTAATPPETGCLAPNIWDIQIRMDVRVWVNITLFVKPATELLRENDVLCVVLTIGGLSIALGPEIIIFFLVTVVVYIFSSVGVLTDYI
jgi:hypothetical protein